ncbi:MAG TPA: hypothetical protein VEF04_02015, partial [Blastocatellia bacterium]|nr:hypothetical protein [Blastocatellia bacterium]
FVSNVLYPRMQKVIYGQSKPYITEDERKLNEHDLLEITRNLQSLELNEYFNFLATRIFPDRIKPLAMMDRVLLVALSPIAHLLSGRVLLSAHIKKNRSRLILV